MEEKDFAESVQIERDIMSTRRLWETVFYTDTEKFVDYYYQKKMPQNLTLTMRNQGEVQAMLHLTPYQAAIGGIRFGEQKEVSYIVGVATAEAFRHKGYMRELLTNALRLCYQKGQPFVFLMPADAAIYQPFQFTYIYDKAESRLNEAVLPEAYLERFLESGQESFLLSYKDGREAQLSAAELSLEKRMKNRQENRTENKENGETVKITTMRESELAEAAEFANTCLSRQYEVFLHRDETYFETLQAEMESQNGAVFMIRQEERLVGYFGYAKEEKAYIQEAVFAEGFDGDELIETAGMAEPAIMARILHVEDMLTYLHVEEKVMLTIKITDPLLTENTGIYTCMFGEAGTIVNKIALEAAAEGQYDCEATVDILTSLLFGYRTARECFPEVSEEVLRKWEAVCCLHGTFINEIV